MFFLLFFATIKYLSDLALLLFKKQQKRPIAESFFNRLAVCATTQGFPVLWDSGVCHRTTGKWPNGPGRRQTGFWRPN